MGGLGVNMLFCNLKFAREMGRSEYRAKHKEAMDVLRSDPEYVQRLQVHYL